MYGNQYSPEVVERAKALGMTTKEAAEVAHQKVEEDQGRQSINLRKEEIHQRDKERAAGGAVTRPLTQNRKSEIEGERKRANAKFEEELRSRPDFIDSHGRFTIPDEFKSEVAQRKLEIENGYRAEMGWAPLEQAEFDLARDASKHEELEKIRFHYRRLTGAEAPLARMESLQKKIEAEKDPTKHGALRQELLTLRKQYREQTGR
jgi:hypothetical protein